MTDQHAITTSAPASIEATRMHPLVQHMLRDNMDPASLRELLTIQREWEAGEAKKAYSIAMVALKKTLPNVLDRDKQVDFSLKTGGRTTYRHTTLAAAVDAVTPHLSAHNFSATWIPESNGKEVKVTCVITHVGGHSESATLVSPPENSGTKNPAQAVASAVTLLQRYTLLSLLGIATRDHVDPEPTDQQAPHDPVAPQPQVNVKRNLNAMSRLKQHNIEKDEAEAYVGRSVQEWTTDDLQKLAELVDRPREREPGED